MLTDAQLTLWQAIRAKDENMGIEALKNQKDLNFMINLGVDGGLIPYISFVIQNNMNTLLDICLEQFNVNLTARDSKYGNSALHWAAKTNNVQAVHILNKYNVDRAILNKLNQKPIDLIPNSATQEIKDLLDPLPSLQGLIAIRFGEKIQPLPAHLVESQSAFLQNYQLQIKQFDENKKRMDEEKQAKRSLTFIHPQ